MAEIPVQERRRGMPAWLWILIAVIIVGLVIWWWASDTDRDRAVGPVSPVEQSGEMDDSVAMAPITSLDQLTAAGTTPIGREVQLTGVTVGESLGDASFWIGSGDQREYVVISETRTPGTPIEGAVDVNPDSVVDIHGTVQSAAAGAPEGAAMGTPTDPLPQGIDHYILADRVTTSAQTGGAL